MILPSLLLVLSANAQPPETVVPVPLSVMAEVERMAAFPLWPGFDPRAVPAAIFDGERTWLFHHKRPPAGFVPDASRAGIAVLSGRAPEIVANSSTSIGGLLTATFMLDPIAARSVSEMAALVVHETFHVFQRQRHSNWQANEADLFAYPFEDAGALTLRRLETLALKRALLAHSRDDAGEQASAAIALRRARFQRLPEAAAAYERGNELNEGLAEYVQGKAAASSPAGVLPDGDFPAEQIRQGGYRTGRALALLLDRLGPGWQTTLEGGDSRSLDELMAEALAHDGVVPAELDDDEREAAWIDASREVAGLRREWSERRDTFLARPGWRLVLVCEGPPLMPQGFDPLNVQRLGEREVLHTRWLKLGNTGGGIEITGQPALTEAGGDHPLFSGVLRLTVAGLAAEPRVQQQGEQITLTDVGVTSTLRGARLEKSGTTLTIHLP